MQPFTCLTAIAMPLLRDNIDTDSIIPSREITAVSKTGLSAGLFAGWRYTSIGRRDPAPDFILNDPRYDGAEILLAGANLGCGSSREHAVWALAEFGFKVLGASSFNPIFFRNCVRNGILAVTLEPAAIEQLAHYVVCDPRINQLTVDLAAGTVRTADGRKWDFFIPVDARDTLLNGLDAIEQTLQGKPQIDAFREADRLQRPWVYGCVQRS